MTQREIVLYDFDGTITRRDTVIPFIIRCGRLSRLIWLSACAVFKHPDRIFSRDRDFIKASIMTASLADLTVKKANRAVERQVQSIMKRGLRLNVVQTIRKHLEQGRDVVIVSASFGIYLEAIAERLGVAHVIATELETVTGRLTGQLLTRNCRSVEKVSRLQDWLVDQQHAVVVAAYGNSTEDLPLLGCARVGFLISRRGINLVRS